MEIPVSLRLASFHLALGPELSRVTELCCMALCIAVLVPSLAMIVCILPAHRAPSLPAISLLLRSPLVEALLVEDMVAGEADGHRGLLCQALMANRTNVLSTAAKAVSLRLVERRSVVRCICSAEPDARSLIAAQVSERFVHPCVHGAGSHIQAASGGADGEEEDESGAVVSSRVELASVWPCGRQRMPGTVSRSG